MFIDRQVEPLFDVAADGEGTLSKEVASINENPESIHFHSLESIKGPRRDPSYVAQKPIKGSGPCFDEAEYRCG
ncbi:hypothetical protein D9M69_507150 [compost metagenome]